jgi:WhiB family redox-sensing transcriptional regulator
VITMVRPTLSVVPTRESQPVPVDLPGPSGAGDRAHPGAELHYRRGLTTIVGGSEWTVRAVCAGGDPDTLFVTGAAQREAAKICQACPVRLECLADALDNRIEYGVWGGMTERQRRAVLKKSPEVSNWRAALEGARTSVDHEEAS